MKKEIKNPQNYALSETECNAVKWLTAHGISGYISRKDEESISFMLRKPGMILYMDCWNKSTRDMTAFLKAVDQELTWRVQQEEYAKQRRIVLHRMRRLMRDMVKFSEENDEEFSWTLSTCVKMGKEIARLRDEYKRLSKVMKWAEWDIYYSWLMWKLPGANSHPFLYRSVISDTFQEGVAE